MLRFEIWKCDQKHQYDEEALIGGNGWNVIWFKCEQDPHISSSVNSSAIGLSVLRFGIWKGELERPIWWKSIDWLKILFL